MPDPIDIPENPVPTPDQGGGDDLGLVPASGKHAARPSQAERHQTLHEYPQTDEKALSGEGVTPDESHYRELEDDTPTGSGR